MHGWRLIVASLCLATAMPAFAGGVLRIQASGYEDFSCRNGAREESEQCDDGNADDLDGCTSQCRVSVACRADAFPGGDRFVVDAATGRCYVLHTEELLTVNQATSVCSTQGGHLASLTSAAEAALLQPSLQAGQRLWIGATDLPEEGSFAWLTGEPFAYQPFAAGQPDGDGDCLVVDAATGTWSDTGCELAAFATGFICEIEP
jgi:cysteine-rich repeat protein